MTAPVYHNAKAKPPRHPFKQLLGIAGGITALVLALQTLGLFQLMEWGILDYWFRIRPSPHSEKALPIVLITIDDDDIAAQGQWPLSDRQLAQFLLKLREQAPAAIGLNLYRDLPVAPGHDELNQVLKSTPNLIGIEKLVGRGTRGAIAPPPGLRNTDQVAFNDLVLDQDGRIRRHLLSVRHNDQTRFSLGTTLALRYLKEELDIHPQSLEQQRIRLGKTEFSPLSANAGAYINADVGGYQILANFSPPIPQMQRVAFRDVVRDRVEPSIFKHKIVLVGLRSCSSWGDRFYTPFSRNSDESWSGVELQASLTAQLLTAALEGRSLLNTLPEFLEWGWILFWAVVGAMCHQCFVLDRRLLRLPLSVGLVIALTYGLFLFQIWLPLIAPVVALGGSWIMAQGYLVWHKLREDKQSLEQTVQLRTQELIEQNQALEQANHDAERANQAKTTFLAHISHELRTPLTAILGFGDLLENSPELPAQEREYAATINRCGEHLLGLINNVLELSKIETSAVILASESVCLPSLIDEIETMFQAQILAKQLNFEVHLDSKLPTWIKTDGSKLRQILINLVGNAIKFTPVGAITLKVQVVSEAASTQDTLLYPLKFEVADTGPGMSADEIKQLFQPFVQTKTGKSLRQGTGLGLALVHHWVEAMGGSITVSSARGVGSKFIVHMPTQSVSPPAAPQTSSPINSATGDPNHHFRILVVEDEADIRHLLTEWLTESKFRVETASTAAIAYQKFEEWHPHLILLDIHLPDFDGYELARRIRTQSVYNSPEDIPQPSRHDEPIILAVTAGVLKENHAELWASGCDDVIWKPLKLDTLLTKIRQYL